MTSRLKNNKKARRNIAPCFLFLSAAFLFAPLSAYAQQDEQQSQQAQLDRLENEVQTLSRALFKGEKPSADVMATYSAGSGSSGGGNTEVRLTQIESEIQALTGKVEQQGFTQDQLQKSLTDMDARIRAMESTHASSGATTTPPTDATSTPTGLSSNDMEDDTHSLIHSAPNANDTSAVKNPDAAATDDTTSPHPLGTLQQNAQGSVTAANSDDPTGQYEKAFSALHDRKYDEAQKGFESFLAQNPNSNLAPNAQYWLGESFYARNDFTHAARTFAESYQKYPKGPKGPDSLLKLALSLAGMGKKSDACLSLGELKRQYATGAGPVLARAQQESTVLGCP